MRIQCETHTSAENYAAVFCEILGTMIREMEHACLTDSNSRNFIVQMIPHHRAAIRMCENLLGYSIGDPLQKIAVDIIVEQARSIHDMCQILDCCAGYRNSCRDLQLYQEHFHTITQNMFQKMDAAPVTDNIADTFMREMIPHHEGAVLMSENALRYGCCPELTPILKAIIATQTKGIEEMRRLLSEQT